MVLGLWTEITHSGTILQGRIGRSTVEGQWGQNADRTGDPIPEGTFVLRRVR